MMRACSTASGSVMFIPDEIERVVKTRSYSEIVGSHMQRQSVRRLDTKHLIFAARRLFLKAA